MADAVLDIDVLIVGAGPVGLFLANECARRGLRWQLVEARSRQSEHSKALAIMPRTLEIFDMAGVADPFLEAANRVTSIGMAGPKGTLARMKFEPEDTPYSFVAMVPQDVTEQLLLEELRSKGGGVDYQTRFVSVVQHDDGVVATVERGGKQRQLKAAYLVGCDGAHSAVRHALDLQFLGEAYNAFFMLADMETNDDLPREEMQLCPSSEGPLAIFPMSATRRRLVATVAAPEADQPSLEVVQRLLSERGPKDIEAKAIHWSSYFRVHHRQVTRLRERRIFLAGDAAHIHSPIGGQGMNTGLHDAWNLIWKLDLALRGHAAPILIDSYNVERTKAVRRVIEMTHLMTRGLGTPSRLAQTVRDLAIPLLFSLAPFRHTMVQRLSQLGLSYSGSPIVKGSGARYFESSLRGGKGICSKFLLMTGGEALDSEKGAARRLAGEMNDIVEFRQIAGDGIKLLRPDGYIACKEAGARAGAVRPIESLLCFMTNAKPAKAFLENQADRRAK